MLQKRYYFNGNKIKSTDGTWRNMERQKEHASVITIMHILLNPYIKCSEVISFIMKQIHKM